MMDRAALEVQSVRAMVADAQRRVAVLSELLERETREKVNDSIYSGLLACELAEVQRDLRDAQSRLVMVESGLPIQQCGRLIRERVKP